MPLLLGKWNQNMNSTAPLKRLRHIRGLQGFYAQSAALVVASYKGHREQIIDLIIGLILLSMLS